MWARVCDAAGVTSVASMTSMASLTSVTWGMAAAEASTPCCCYS
jgi:hypothetical protein